MEFTNTFDNGLSKDSNILLQPKGTYRDMYNGMLVSYDGNHYVVELPKGTRVTFTIPPIYDGVYTSPAALPSPIGFISFLDVLVVFSTNSKVDADTGGYGEIGIVTFDKDGTGTYVPKYNHPSLNFSLFHQIRGFTYEENDRIKRVYWTDDFNEPRVLNIKDPALNAVASGSLTVGTQYMVTGGAITHNAVIYGPGLVAGNVFTAVNANYTVTDGSPIVTQYIDYHLLSWTPDRILPYIDFNGPVSGALFGGSKSYFVRYLNKDLGLTTGWSYGSFPINVYDIIGTSYITAAGSGAGGVLATSNVGVELKISNIDQLYDTMEVAVAEFDQGYNVLRSANIFATVPITSTEMIVQHVSETGGTELTLNDLTLFPASILRVKDITTSKNYNIVANISERDELNFTVNGTATIDDLTYRIPVDDARNDFPNAGQSKQPESGVASGTILPEGKYVVTGTGVVRYGTNDYGQTQPLGPYFIGVFGGPTYTVLSGTPVVKGCILLKKYKSLAGFDRWKHIELNNDYFDYRGMATTQYLRQYWGQETYRIGVLFYDLKGNPYYVKWIGDHVTQSYSDKGGPMANNGGFFSAQLNGKVISALSIPASEINNISGFSIVRAPRDKQRLAQGLVFPTVKDSSNIRPLALATTGSDSNFGGYGGDAKIIDWYSPDGLLSFSDFSPTSANKLEGECFIDPIANFYKVNGTSNSIYSKFYARNGANVQEKTILRYDNIIPNQSISSYDGGYNYENSSLNTNAGSPVGTASAIGGNHALIKTDIDIYFPGGQSLVAPSETGNYAKILMNYKVVKSNLYSGSSPTALANTIYISTGHYQPIDSAVKADTYDVGTDSYIFNEIHVFGGDSFLGIFDLSHGLYNDAYGSPYEYFLFFPVETSVNHYLRQGRHFSKDGGFNAIDGVAYSDAGQTRLEEFAVNNGYASDGSIIAYPATPETLFNDRFPYRVRWAGPKTLGESIDSFRMFLVNNFRDLDGNKGQINNVRARDGKLFYWQDHGIGYLPILERQVVNGTLGEATQLGVGGVIDRFDEINTYFGNQHTNGLVETEYGFTWFDFRQRAFLAMTVGGGIQEVSFVKGLETFFNNSALFYASQLTNSGLELQNNDTPLIGIGITGVYDPMYKMTYLTFKWVEGEDEVPTYWKNLTVGYYHPRNLFVGFFDLKGAIYKNHNNLVVGAKNVNVADIQPDTEYIIGDNVNKNNVEYVAIVDFTTNNPVQSYQQPDFGGSVFWSKTVATNETHLLFSTLAFCKFFGQVYNHSIEFVINPKTGKPFAVDNLLHKGNDVNYDVILCTTDDDSSTERTNNRFYRYVDKFWQSSIPMGTNGRLVDSYLKVKYTLNNYTNNPTISRNLQKLFEFISSTFREKK